MTKEELKAALDGLQEALDAKQARIEAGIQALKDQIAAGSPVTEADLDSLGAQIGNIRADLESTVEG